MIRARIVIWVLMAGLSQQAAHSQSLDQLAEQFFLAGEAERVQMIAAHPTFRDVPFRQEISTKGIDALRRGEFALADRYQKTVLWLGNHFDNDAVRAVAFINLASINGQRGDFAAAQRYALDALTFAEKENDLESVQSASANLGIIRRRLGDVDGALQNFERALSLAEQLNLPENAARVVNNIGLAYSDLGNQAMALDYLERSLAMKLKLPENPGVLRDTANGLLNIGTLYDEVGDYPRALDYYQRALTMIEKVGGPTVSSTMGNIGRIHNKLGDRTQARAYLDRAMALSNAQGDKPRIATLFYLLGVLERDAGQLAVAEELQRRSLALREEIGETITLVESLIELSSLAMTGGRPADAYAAASRAVTIATTRSAPGRLQKAQMAAADALAALKRDDEAMAFYEASIEGIETLRQMTVGGDRGLQQYLGQRVGPYYGLARVHANAGRPFDALLAVERARARTLLEVIAGGRHSMRLLTPEQRDREQELSQAVVSASIEIDNLVGRRKYDPAQLVELEAKLSRARMARGSYMAALYKSTPDLRIARGDAPAVTREDLNALVKPATAIVSLVLDNKSVWAYVITRNSGGVSVAARQVALTAEELVRLADEFARQVATRDLGFAANARKLYDVLFVDTKIEPLLNGKSQLIVIPEGALWRVPFQALQTPRDTFLIEERAVAYSPSVSALSALDRRRRTREQRQPYLLALGDPAIGGPGNAPSRGSFKGRLPQAAREVRALGQLYGANRSHVLVAEQATESALRDHLGRASVVHVATHGILDDLSPMYSHVLLAPKSRDRSGDDGRLEAWELANLNLDVDLAILSACETARGPVGDGEGVIGLSWSLFAAGASTAVVSQWEVDSASTTALMIAFHERLLLSSRNDNSVAAAPEALRVAAMRLMRGPAYRHPFYWAGFVVIGAS